MKAVLGIKQVIFVGIIPLFFSCRMTSIERSQVIVFTDINIDKGDPDDRQSLIHLLWYADVLDIKAVIPDRWDAGGYEACVLGLEAYRKDYNLLWSSSEAYPAPDDLSNVIANDEKEAERLFLNAFSADDGPIYLLVWGNMELCQSLLTKHSGFKDRVRLITIGTGLMLEKDIPYMPESWPKSDPCVQLNWNGSGRDAIYNNSLFDSLWWIEMNWTYAGMFDGEGPSDIFRDLVEYGYLGKHMKEVVKNHAWAQYFRVGDTPSVLYLLDDKHDIDDPTESSWAGIYYRPFPDSKPNYFTDYSGDISWNYSNPCATWEQHAAVATFAQGTLIDRREDMYQSLLSKLDHIYRR